MENKLDQLLSNGSGELQANKILAYLQDIRGDSNAIEAFAKIFSELTDDEIDQLYIESDCPEREDVLGLILDSKIEMNLLLVGSSNYLASELKFYDYGEECAAELSWIDSFAGNVLWDRIEFKTNTPVLDYYLSYVDSFDVANYIHATKPKPIHIPLLAKYHPERFKLFRKYASSVASIYKEEVDRDTGMLSVGQLNLITQMIVPELNNKAVSYPRKKKIDSDPGSAILNIEINLATAFARFIHSGRQIMALPQHLVEMLRHTDVSDVPLDSIHLPYSSQYIHFGKIADLELETGWFVDGAYVEKRGEAGDIRVTITTAPDDLADTANWHSCPEPEYTQDFVGEYRKMDLGLAAETVLSEGLAALHKKRELGLPLLSGAAAHNTEPSPDRVDSETERLQKKHQVYLETLRLVVNALFYITAYPEDRQARWPESTPEKLLKKATSGSPKEKVRAISKLESLGYKPVYICGLKLQASAKESRDGNSMSTHWRRGHWRRQPFGPKRMLRKLIWVLPTLIGTKDENDVETGHLYLVDSDG